jgi:hypothetical protein
MYEALGLPGLDSLLNAPLFERNDILKCLQI